MRGKKIWSMCLSMCVLVVLGLGIHTTIMAEMPAPLDPPEKVVVAYEICHPVRGG